MVLTNIRLRKRRIHKIVCCRILPFQEIFDVELIVFFKMKDLCIVQFQSVNFLLKLSDQFFIARLEQMFESSLGAQESRAISAR